MNFSGKLPHQTRRQELCTGKAKGAVSNYEDIASSLAKRLRCLDMFLCSFFFCQMSPKNCKRKNKLGGRNVM